MVQHELNEAFDSALGETTDSASCSGRAEISNREVLVTPNTSLTLKMHKEYLTYLVRDAKGEILMQSHDANPKIFNQRPAEGFSTTKKYRLVRRQCAT